MKTAVEKSIFWSEIRSGVRGRLVYLVNICIFCCCCCLFFCLFLFCFVCLFCFVFFFCFLPAKEAELAAQITKKRPVSRAVHPSKASSTRIRIFLNPQIIFADSKIFTSTRIHIQIEFARPHVSGFTRSSSANL